MRCGRHIDWVGINFWPGSKRFVKDVSLAKEVAAAAKESGVKEVVGLFVNQPLSWIQEISSEVGLSLVQLHGGESKSFASNVELPVVQAVVVQQANEYFGDYLLVDAPQENHGGAGLAWQWSKAESVSRMHPRVLLAGGLTSENVSVAVSQSRAWGVDVASGVEESPGIKSESKVAAFAAAAKGIA